MAEPARFFDTRAAYMMFVTTTNEKAVVADRLGDELETIRPEPPGLRVFDAGMGDASVLGQLMRRLHEVFPHIPALVVGKEISIEDVRQALARLPDRFSEHPEMVVVVTNMSFAEAPSLTPSTERGRKALRWRDVPLEGDTAHAFAEQIRELYGILADDWRVRTSPTTGNPLYATPSVLVLYRRDHEFLLRSLIPRPGATDDVYDFVVASQPYRAATPLERKVSTVLVPLVRTLAPGGRMVVVHAYGNDPGVEIIRNVWPEEQPFPHGREELLAELHRQLDQPEDADLMFPTLADGEAILRYDLHAMPSVAAEHIGTSSVLAAWNAAVYNAQIDEPRMAEAMASGAYLDATMNVVRRYGEVWFNDEVYLIVRRR